MAESRNTPTRRSARTAARQQNDPYPFAPLLLNDLPPAPTNVGVLFATYLTFLSRRHLHCYVLYLALACLASAWFFRLEFGVLSVPALAWFFFLRPKIHISSKACAREFFWSNGTRSIYSINMAAVYVASTGFKDEKGCDIMGLYANQFIKKGYGCCNVFHCLHSCFSISLP